MDGPDDAPQARAPEPEDLARICRSLNASGARYLLIGGFAVIAHGAGRFTKDIDLLIDDQAENVALVRRALSILTDNAAADVGDNDLRTYVVVRVVDEIVIDLMGRACGVAYQDVEDDIEHHQVLGVDIPVASPAALIRMKDTFRPQDAEDRRFLESVLEERSKK